MEAIEHKLDITVSKTNQNAAHIQVLQEQLNTALSRIDDLENRSRSYNFRIRGLPETVTEIPPAVQSLIKDLIQRGVRQSPQSPGAPREGWIPERCHCKAALLCPKGGGYATITHQVQSDVPRSPNTNFLSPSTIQKLRTLK